MRPQAPQQSAPQVRNQPQSNRPAPVDDKALPKPKSFGQIMTKKGPEPSKPAPPATPAGGPARNVFTVIGSNDDPAPPAQGRSPRLPFPDESILPSSESSGSNWQNTPAPSTYRGVTPESQQPSQTSFDSLPSEDWDLGDSDAQQKAAEQNSTSPFAPPGAAASTTDESKDEPKRPVIPFPDESAIFVPPQGAAPLGTPGSASGFGDSPEPSSSTEFAPDPPQESSPFAAQSEDSAENQTEKEEGEESGPRHDTREPQDEPERGAPNTKQFREACLAASTADSAMGNDNYKVALPLFKKAYKLFKKASASDSQEFGNCLHKLADCYYHGEEYEEALAHYNEFCEWSEQRPTDALAVVVCLKRARTFQKLDRIEECDEAFHFTVMLANEVLPVSHPLFTVVYNSYISMLQFSGNSPEKMKAVEEQFAERMMKSSRTVAIPEDLQEELSAWTDLEKAEQERLERNRQLKLSRHMFQNERSRPGQVVHSIAGSGAFKTIVIVVVSLLLFGSLGLMGFGAYTLLDQSGDKPAAKDLIDAGLTPFVGQVFRSADGLKTLTIKKDGTASFAFGNDAATTAAVAGPPKEGITEDLRHMMFGKTNYILEQVPEGFKDPDGTILYAEDSKNLRITNDMQNIADLANYYYSRHQSRYPKKRKDFSEMGPDVKWENPLGQAIKPIIKAHEFEKYDGDVAFSETLDKYRKGKKIFDQDGKTGAPPGLIECLSLVPFDEYHTEDGVAFMVRAYDSSGRFLTSSLPGEVFVVCQKNGVKHIIAKPEDIKSPIKDSSKTVSHFKLMNAKN
jgi:tetratricopeptide (TPR) repeat protein